VSKTSKKVSRRSRQERGQAISEYAVTLGVILVIAPLAFRLLDISIMEIFHFIANQIH
jgi:Flp pilus assembly pilin Flp